MSTYEPVEDGGWMYLPRRGMQLACCDCCLVHDLTAHVDTNGKIWVRVVRNNRSTAALRRPMKFTKDDE